MHETIIGSVLSEKIAHDVLVKWLNDETIEDSPENEALLCCNRSEFVVYFLSFLRQQTDSILQTSSNALTLIQHQATPEKILTSRRKHKRSVSEPTSEVEADRTTDSLSVKTDKHRSHESPNRDRKDPKKSNRRVKTKLFNENDRSKEHNSSFLSSKTDSDESRISSGVERLVLSSTPLKNGVKPTEYQNLSLTSPVTPQSRSFGNFDRCDTPRSNQKHSKSQEKSSFGDFLVTAQVKSSKKKRTTPKNISSEAEDTKVSLDLSSSDMFPEIGARKASSLRSEKRRIKPTNIDTSTPQKSLSLNSFNSESFQQPSPLALEENLAFKFQKLQPKELANSFDAERNILKQERHKLMEKFNILNSTSSPSTPLSPQIKITKKDNNEKNQNFVKADSNKIMFKEKVDILVEIYEILIKNNLILSVSSEIYFLISVLLSQQYEEDYANIESKLSEENLSENVLKTIHNSTYFAVKSLWHQKYILEFMLDKNSLKILGENKKVRSFYPDLAKFLLNLYGIKTEIDSAKEEKPVTALENQYPNGIVCFNFETDNADNFPSLLSFQNFKKQRDMFYEILRWYTENPSSPKSSFRTRVKTLLSLAVAPANHAHLARLWASHMAAECRPSNTQESKLSKLHRRLTGPATHESRRLPRFSSKEMFYKEFIMFAENESFRVHARDTLASEICVLNATALGSTEDRGSAPNTDLSKDYLALLQRLRLLSKFLGFLTSLPHTQTPVEYSIKSGQAAQGREQQYLSVPKEKVLENAVRLRNYSQPSIDLLGILHEANQNARLCITLPWLTQYLSMIDYTGLRTKYYELLLKNIFEIYTEKLKFTNENIKRNTVIFLKLTLGWLFDLPHFPQESFYEKFSEFKMAETSVASAENIDSLDVIDESIIFESCPFLKDVNVLLVTSKPSQDAKEASSFRHITPVTMTLNPEDRIKNKEKEIQARLEQEYLKSLPSSTRRVLELISERARASCVKEVGARTTHARVTWRRRAGALVAADQSHDLLSALKALHTAHTNAFHAQIQDFIQKHIASQVQSGLQSWNLAEPVLARVLTRAALDKMQRGYRPDVLCKDIEEEMRNLLVLGDRVLKDEEQSLPVNVERLTLPKEQFEATHVSPNGVIIHVKEHICLLLSSPSPAPPTAPLLAQAARVCHRDNVFTRRPTLRALLQLTVDLCVVFVSRKPKELTEELLNHFHAIWDQCCPDRKKHEPQDLGPPERRPDLSPDLRNFDADDRAPTPVSDDEGTKKVTKIVISNNFSERNGQNTRFSFPNKTLSSPVLPIGNSSPIIPNLAPLSPKVFAKPLSPNSYKMSYSAGPASPNSTKISYKNSYSGPASPNTLAVKTSNTTSGTQNDDLISYFDRILCPRNIVLLSRAKCPSADVWQAMASLLVFLLKHDYLGEDSLTEQCLAVYRQDWSQSTLESLSACLKTVSGRWARAASGKFTLFLDFLAEYCVDMDHGDGLMDH
ncbi:uncharacterized protein LOC119694685 [Plutella xylostella]|uniref:uncharacterized protein LOC119694685 n=1 Tax=Plutella xylostella TaxID=51655 RepID=UPI0020324415|nr:uncharacterized protein LOC119694685 [Plutella xylostella]